MNSLQEIWQEVLEIISQKHSVQSFNLWFKELILYKLTATRAYVATKYDFHCTIIKERYMDDIRGGMKEILGFAVDIELFCCEEGQDMETQLQRHISKMIDDMSCEENDPMLNQSEDGEEEETLTRTNGTEGSNPEYTFEKFIVGDANKFAYNACVSVAEKPSLLYNPLYIYGPSGMGKTHLLYAITDKLKREHPDLKVLYVRGEAFATELIENLSNKKPMQYFREKYRSVDVILIDDIHFIAGKESCQEEFFHTFNALHEQRKQIVLSSDRPPREMKTLEERLRTRFDWGLIVDITPPDVELRTAILKNKARDWGIEVPDKIITFLAENVRNNIRQLEGAIRKIYAYSLVNSTPLTVDKLKVLVGELYTSELPPNFATDTVFERVAARYNVSVEDICSEKRNKNIVSARHIALYIMRENLDMTYPAISTKMNMHHSTVMSAVEKIKGLMKKNPAFDLEVNELGNEIDAAIDNA